MALARSASIVTARVALLLLIAPALLLAGAQPGATVPTGDDDPERIKDAAAHYPVIVTARTLADPAALSALQAPGKVIFSDGFESPDSLKAYFEILGLKEGRVTLTTDPTLAHSGTGALRLTAPENGGRSIGAGPSYWFGDRRENDPADDARVAPGSAKSGDGFDCVYLRYYIRFAADYDQGNLNHTGGGLAATSGTRMWDGMGNAGIRPSGDDRFTTAFEPWRDWGRNEPPGAMHLYTYWMDMTRDRDGHFWGNMMLPDPPARIIPKRARWYCMEQMIKANTPGRADGELAAWIDGNLYIHATGFRWRTSAEVKLKRFNIAIYIHQSTRENTVWYDDVVLSTGYIGPTDDPPVPHPNR